MLRAIPRKPLPRVLEERLRYAKVKQQRDAQKTQKKRERLNQLITRINQVQYSRALKQKRIKSRADEMEDRWLGPLAPKRVVNEIEKQLHNSLEQDEINPPPVKWSEKMKYWNIVPKDRVVILKGPDKHKIGTVKAIFKESNTLVVDGMNMINVAIPQYLMKIYEESNPNAARTFSREVPLHYNDVRLVYPLPNPETGELEDTIIANIETVNVYFDRETGNRGWKRAIAGEGTVIPWPKYPPKELVEFDADTRQLDVDNITYKPTLLVPPIPSIVIDELRNKYSKFRRRHEPEYIEKMWAHEEAAKGPAKIRTPLQMLNRKIRLEKKALGPPKLTEDLLERIGRVMAQNKPELARRLRQEPEPEIDV